MRPPSAASVLILFASIALALSARFSSAPDAVVINRGFIDEVNQLQRTGAAMTDDSRLTQLIWDHAEEFRYLVRTDDLLATVVAMRFAAAGRIPGGCACHTLEFDADLCFEGVPDTFWRELRAMRVGDQLAVILAVDRHGYDEIDAASDWESDRDAFLWGRAELHSRYTVAIASLPPDR